MLGRVNGEKKLAIKIRYLQIIAELMSWKGNFEWQRL